MTDPSTSRQRTKLVHGDLVDVKSAEEILQTLDDQGTTEQLPFMPEMLGMLGGRFRVHKRVDHFSFDGDETCGDESSVRAFVDNDVVILENCRCSGVAHGLCKRGCSVFWREAWLRPTSAMAPAASAGDSAKLEARLNTRSPQDSERFFCQSSQLLVATHPVSFLGRVRACVRNVISGNYGLFEMLRNICVWIYVRGRAKLLGNFPVGNLKQTPAQSLGLQVGERVRVKSLAEIKQTLDHRGFNRGLHFAPEMIPYCGKEMKVAARADRMIAEGLGNMRTMKNTVILEDCVCDSATWAFGACPRQDYIYWREIWLQRVEAVAQTNGIHGQQSTEEVEVAQR